MTDSGVGTRESCDKPISPWMKGTDEAVLPGPAAIACGVIGVDTQPAANTQAATVRLPAIRRCPCDATLVIRFKGILLE